MATGAHSDSTCTPITGPMPHALISGSVPLRDHTALCCWFRGSSGLLRIQSGIHSNDSGEKLVTGFGQYSTSLNFISDLLSFCAFL